MTFRRPLPAPQGAAGSVLATNALLSLSAFGLVGLLGRAARLKTLLVAAPLLALAASLALWLLSALSAVSADGEVGRVARGALLVIALVSAAAPIVPLALVPANAEPSQLGRGYGIVESVFEGAEASLSLLPRRVPARQEGQTQRPGVRLRPSLDDQAHRHRGRLRSPLRARAAPDKNAAGAKHRPFSCLGRLMWNISRAQHPLHVGEHGAATY